MGRPKPAPLQEAQGRGTLKFKFTERLAHPPPENSTATAKAAPPASVDRAAGTVAKIDASSRSLAPIKPKHGSAAQY